MTINLSNLYAHTPGDHGYWDYLDRHLTDVASKARSFGEAFGAADLTYMLGLLHDLGKINPSFQDYLRAQANGEKHSKVPHAIWGAALVYWLLWKKSGKQEEWKELALPIHGHHAGLGNGGILAQDLEIFLSKQGIDALPLIKEACTELHLPSFAISCLSQPCRRELFIRMIFSALVDADYLVTERHFEPERAQQRGQWPCIETLWNRFEVKQEELLHEAAGNPTMVNRVRREVYEACLQATDDLPGIFRLTVPTGGGKTRSSLAFALKHALRYKLRRILVALPYTSIIDQTASVYRDILGAESVLEHHSQITVSEDKDENHDPKSIRFRLATENWDAPLIVTTTVQLLESLLSNRTSRARKLHRLAKSVIILDEVQTLPVTLLSPTLDVLRALVEDYNVTLVLCTATQPAFDDTPYLKEFQGLKIRNIVSDYPRHFQVLKRVTYERREVPVNWQDLADEIKHHDQAMVILNTRKDALSLLDALEDTEGLFHLSTLLCSVHRRKVLDEIKMRLSRNDWLKRVPARLISTQVVEAGVDLDFPVVYRAIGPLDRIVQAAGRCNREGEGPEMGRVVIFEPATGGMPRGAYRAGLEQAKLILRRHETEDLHDPELYREYFQRLFSDVNLDAKDIQEYREHLNYPEVAHRYRLIEQDTTPVVVTYNNSEQILKRWERQPCRETWRDLQPYLVNIYSYQTQQFLHDGLMMPISDGLYRWIGKYDETRGIANGAFDPSDLVISDSDK